MRQLPTLLLIVLCLLAGCDSEAAFDRFTPKEEAKAATQVLAQIAAREFVAVEAQLDANLLGPATREKLEQMASQFPSSEAHSIKVIGANTAIASDATTYTIGFEHEYPSSWLVSNVVLQRREGRLLIMGVHVNPTSQSLKTLNRFTFAGKGDLHYLFVVLAVCVPAFVIYVLFVCFRTPMARRKWLWMLFIAMGFVQISLNWTTGALGVQPISFLLLGAGYTKTGPVAPWVITVAIPLGAMIFLARRNKLRVQVSADRVSGQ